MDSLAREGMLFERAYSNAPYTTASIVSLLTSGYPLAMKGKELHMSQFLTLTEVLAEHNFATVGVHSNPWFSLYKFGQGFEKFEDPLYNRRYLVYRYGRALWKRLFRPASKREEENEFNFAPAQELNRTSENILGKVQGNVFFWIHYMDVHEPNYPGKFYFGHDLSHEEVKGLHMKSWYDPGSLDESEQKSVIDLYDNCVRGLDADIENLYKRILPRCDPEETLFVITADHGEALGEKGYYGHGGRNRPVSLYDFNIHIPLIFFTRNELLRDTLSSRLGATPHRGMVSLVDLAPTLLSLYGIPVPGRFMGRNVLKEPEKSVPVLSQGVQAERPNNMVHVRQGVLLSGWRTDRFKLIEKEGRLQLYDVVSDPLEGKNLAEEDPATASNLLSDMQQKLASLSDLKKRNDARRALSKLKVPRK